MCVMVCVHIAMIVFDCSGCCESAPKLEARNPNPQCCLHGQAQPYPATPFFFNICFIRSPDQQIGFLSDQQITAPDPADQPQQTGHIGQISRPADRSYRAYRNAHGFIRSIRSADRTPSDIQYCMRMRLAEVLRTRVATSVTGLSCTNRQFAP